MHKNIYVKINKIKRGMKQNEELNDTRSKGSNPKDARREGVQGEGGGLIDAERCGLHNTLSVTFRHCNIGLKLKIGRAHV